MQVIVTDCHYRFTLALIRELAAAGHRVTAVCEGGKAPVGLACKQAFDTRLLPERLSAADYQECLLNLCHGMERPVLLPAGARTIETVARARAEFKPLARFLLSGPDVLEQAGDKSAVARLAAGLGIPTPEALTPEGDETIEKFAERLAYPVVLKYRCGEKLNLPAERRYTIARSDTEFLRRYRNMHDVQPPVMVQKYIRGPGLGVSVLMDAEHRPAAVFCHERLREYPVSGGPSTACRSAWFPALVPRAVALLQALSFTGFAMVEFKGPPDDARLLEINPRIWGSYPLAPLSGARMADAYVRAAYGADPPETLACTYETGVRMQYFVSDAMAALGYLGRGQMAQAGAFVRDSFSRKTKGGVYARGDRSGSFAYLKALLSRKEKRHEA